MNDLVQIDIDTALALYLKGYTHIPVLQRDGYSSDWSSMQPLYLDDVLVNLMAFASDSKRAELLNPPKPDIKTMKEDIALHYEPHFRIDPEEDDEDDDPDWVETEDPKVESIPDDDEVPEFRAASIEEIEEREQKTDKEKVEELISEIQLGTIEPFKWNAREAVRLNDSGVSQRDLAELYGISVPTVNRRLKEYKSKS
jgi:hypothetical protein